MPIRNTLHSNPASAQNFLNRLTSMNQSSTTQNELLSSSMGRGKDSFRGTLSQASFNGGSYNSQLAQNKQKMTMPALLEKFKRGESFTENELTFIKKTKGGIEQVENTMKAMKAKGEGEFIADLLDKYKVAPSDRKKMVIDVTKENTHSDSFLVKVSGLSDSEVAKKLESELNAPSKMNHGKTLFQFHESNSKSLQKLPDLIKNSENMTKAMDFLKSSGFTGTIASLGVKEGKITGLPEKLDKLLNDPKLTGEKPSTLQSVKSGLIQKMALSSLNSGKEIPNPAAKVSIKGESLVVIEQPEMAELAKKVTLPPSTESFNKLLNKNPLAWYEMVVSQNQQPNSAKSLNLVG